MTTAEWKRIQRAAAAGRPVGTLPLATTALTPSPAARALLRLAAAHWPRLPCQHPSRGKWWSSEDGEEQEAASRLCLTACPICQSCAATYLAEPRRWAGVVLGGYAATPSRASGALHRRRVVGLPLTVPSPSLARARAKG